MNSSTPRRARSFAPLRLLALLGLLLPASGCMSTLGTTLTEGKTPYAGVQVASVAFTTDPTTGILAALDFFPSAALDTLLLPVTLPRSLSQ